MKTDPPSNEDSTVGEADLIAVTRLLGELAVFEASLDHKRRYLIDGLSKIVEADGWLWAMGKVDPDLHSPMPMGFLTGGLRVMGGFFGIVTKEDCSRDLFYGTDYHSHLGTMRGGLVVDNGGAFVRHIHDISNAQFRS